MNLECIWFECERQGISVGEKQQLQIETFLSDLYFVNEKTNLTRVPREDAPMRHVVDSLLVLPFIPRDCRVLDIGCGPGFPAWVLAWARPDLTVVAMDSASKMQRFLAGHPLPNLLQVVDRAEEISQPEHFDVVTGRAVAPFGIQAELSAAWLRVGGLFVPFRTLAEREEIARANVGMLGLKLKEISEVEVPGGESTRLFPVYEKIKATPKEYPRTWAKIRLRPLASF